MGLAEQNSATIAEIGDQVIECPPESVIGEFVEREWGTMVGSANDGENCQQRYAKALATDRRARKLLKLTAKRLANGITN